MVKAAVKKIYRAVPLKRELFGLLKTVWKPTEKVYKHLYFYGDFVVNTDEGRTYKIRHHGYSLENELFWEGEEDGPERMSLSLWKKLVRHSEVILDIGANTGQYALTAETINPSAAIYCFEPLPETCKKLELNRELNNYKFFIIDKALSDYSGDALVYMDAGTDFDYSVAVNKRLNPTQVVKVPIKVVRLDEFIETNDIKRVDLMKVDVETHEAEVLEGMGQYLDRFRPTLLIEILNDEVGKAVENIVRNLGYSYYNIDDGVRAIRKVDRITKSDFYNYLFCTPETAESIGLAS
ncbi:MAG: FkbM family methyltransferase [Chloracidobacterium sp.]|nr:FkbM family methyltransferase [Chloracidobacterium sp.]